MLAAWVERTSRQAEKQDGGGLRFAFYGRVSTEDWQKIGRTNAEQLFGLKLSAAAA